MGAQSSPPRRKPRGVGRKAIWAKGDIARCRCLTGSGLAPPGLGCRGDSGPWVRGHAALPSGRGAGHRTRVSVGAGHWPRVGPGHLICSGVAGGLPKAPVARTAVVDGDSFPSGGAGTRSGFGGLEVLRGRDQGSCRTSRLPRTAPRQGAVSPKGQQCRGRVRKFAAEEWGSWGQQQAPP